MRFAHVMLLSAIKNCKDKGQGFEYVQPNREPVSDFHRYMAIVQFIDEWGWNTNFDGWSIRGKVHRLYCGLFYETRKRHQWGCIETIIGTSRQGYQAHSSVSYLGYRTACAVI